MRTIKNRSLWIRRNRLTRERCPWPGSFSRRPFNNPWPYCVRRPLLHQLHCRLTGLMQRDGLNSASQDLGDGLCRAEVVMSFSPWITREKVQEVNVGRMTKAPSFRSCHPLRSPPSIHLFIGLATIKQQPDFQALSFWNLDTAKTLKQDFIKVCIVRINMFSKGIIAHHVRQLRISTFTSVWQNGNSHKAMFLRHFLQFAFRPLAKIRNFILHTLPCQFFLTRMPRAKAKVSKHVLQIFSLTRYILQIPLSRPLWTWRNS